MRQSTALLLSAFLSIAAALVVAAAAFLLGGRLGIWQWLFYAGALLTVLAALYPFRQATWGSRRWMRGPARTDTQPAGRKCGNPKTCPPSPTSSHPSSKNDSSKSNDASANWPTGSPAIISGSSSHRLSISPRPSVQARTPSKEIANSTSSSKTVHRILYEKIRQNAYSQEGKFQFSLARDDIYDLACQIASLYGNDPDRPLAGVSSERGPSSRWTLLSQVPRRTRKAPPRHPQLRHCRTSTVTSVRPSTSTASTAPLARYMPWFRGAYYGTWIAMGANPLALGAWWFVSSMGTKGASTVATNVANRWALSFLHDIVRVIGYEVASVYDPNLRYRDPNWCFAAELTELVQTFPNSEKSLRRALSLIGALQLPNEYDRIYFFRCVVEGKRAELKRSHAADLLPEQRREIARTP